MFKINGKIPIVSATFGLVGLALVFFTEMLVRRYDSRWLTPPIDGVDSITRKSCKCRRLAHRISWRHITNQPLLHSKSSLPYSRFVRYLWRSKVGRTPIEATAPRSDLCRVASRWLGEQNYLYTESNDWIQPPVTPFLLSNDVRRPFEKAP